MAKKNIDTLQPKVVDLTKTGPLSYRQLQALNGGLPAISEDAPDFAMPNPYQGVGDLTYLETGNDFGESAYDTKGLVSQEEFENYEEYRAERQPWYAQLGAGLAKGAVLAGTTFLDGTLGLIFGLRQGIDNLRDDDPNTGFWQGIWDNEFTRATKEFNEQMEKELPNYYTRDELESPWYTNIFTSNFIGDKFIKNLGFSVGALYSGGVWSKALSGLSKGIGLITKSVNAPKMVSTAIGSTMSALNEAKMEALQNSDDWYNTQKLALDNYYKASLDNALTDEARLEASEKYEEAMAKLNEDRAKMGNMDMLLNMPILMASNIVQFGKFYANGYKTARKANNILGRAGEYVAEKTPWKGKVAVTKGALSEGLEEISQAAASRISGDYYQTDVQNFYKSRFDPDAEQKTLSWMKAFAQGINETVNDGSAWEEFFIGTLTGALGVPGFKKKANGKLGFGINGGAYNEYQEYKEQMAREQEIADRMNERVQSPEFLNYYQGLIRHNKYQGMMNDAADRGDEFDYKNAEHAQFVSDIAMFDNAGKIEDLKTLINEAFDTSDENLDSIIRNTTAKTEGGDLIGPYAKYAQIDPETGQIVSSFGSEKSKQEMIDKLTKSKDEMIESINDYIKIKDDIDIRTGQKLTDEQLEELTWMKSQIGDWANRATSVSGDVRAALSNISGNIQMLRDFLDELRTEEGQYHETDEKGNVDYSPTPAYLDLDERIGRLDKALSTLSAIRKGDNSTLASNLAANPKYVEALKNEIDAIPEEVMGLGSKEDIKAKLDDIIKLGTASQTYKVKLEEYLNNPEEQVKAQSRVKESIKDANGLRQKMSNIDRVRESDTRDLAAAARDGSVNLDDLEAAMAALEGGDAEEQKGKVAEARAINENADRLAKALDDSLQDLDDTVDLLEAQAVVNDAKALLAKATEQADSVDELLDTNTEAWLDPRNLPVGEDESINIEEAQERLDAARSLVQQQLSQLKEAAEVMARMPKPEKGKSETPQGQAPQPAPQTGHDPVDKADTENERKKKEEEAKGAARAKEDVTATYNNGIASITSTMPDMIRDGYQAAADKLLADVNMLLNEGKSDSEISQIISANSTYKGMNLVNPRINNVLNSYLASYRAAAQQPQIPKPTSQTPAPRITTPVLEPNKVAPIQPPAADMGSSKVGGTYMFLRPSTTELPIHYEGGPTTPYHEQVKGTGKYTEAQEKRMEAVHSYLTENGAFKRVNEGRVQAGDTVGFKIDPTLNEKAGDTVILITDKDGKVIGDLPTRSDRTFGDYAGLSQLVDEIEDEYKKTGKITKTTKVDKNFVGKVPTTDTYIPLNTISEGKGFTLGIAMEGGSMPPIMIEGGRTKKTSGDRDNLAIRPANAAAGQPFLMLETSSANRHYMPVPILMDKFGEETKDTKLHKEVEDTLHKILTGAARPTELKDDLLDLLALEDAYIEYKGNEVKLRAKVQGRGWVEIYKGAMTPDALPQVLKTLEGTPYQISRKFINGDYKGHSYNDMIGEIAKANLPVGTRHTVSDWFSLKLTNGQKTISPRTRGENPHRAESNFVTVNYKGVPLTVDTKSWEVSDSTGKVYRGERADLAKAYAWGLHTNQDMTKPYVSKWGKFDPVKGAFVKAIPTAPQVDESLLAGLDDAAQGLEEFLASQAAGQPSVTPPSGPTTGGTTVFTDEERAKYEAERAEWAKTHPITAKVDEYAGYFEGGGSSIFDLYPDFNQDIAAKYENYHLGDGEFTEVDAAAFMAEVNRNEALKHQRPVVDPETAELSEDEATAKVAGLIQSAKRKQLWEALSLNSKRVIAEKAGKPKAAQWIDALEKVFNPSTNTFDTKKLRGNPSSIEEYLGTKPKYERVENTGKVWNQKKEMAWLSQALPQFSNEDRTRVHNGLIKIAEDDGGGEAYGQFWRGVITVANNAAGGTLYHEAFHAVANTLLTDQEQDNLFKAAQEKWGNIGMLALEEKMAEDFKNYVQLEETPVLGKVVKLYRTLKHIVQNLLGKEPYLNKIYYNINRGKYSDRAIQDSDATPKYSDQELQQIKEEAIANGTFMKAPNGKPTNLTERQWLQVRTKAFKNWFGDWVKYANVSPEVEEQLALVFERIPELSKTGSIREYAAYLADKFPNSVDRSIYWHGTNEDLSEGFKSAKRGKGSGAPETQSRNDFYLAKQAWAVLQYVNGVNRNSVDKNGFAHWNKLWWELKEIMSNGRRENNNWKDIVIGEETVRQGIPNKKGVFNRDKGGENGKWLSERKADYGYENKSDKEFFEDILGIQWGKDTFNTWTKRNAEVFKALEKTQKGIYPAIINTQNPIREKGQNTYYEEQRGLFTQAEREGNDAILGEYTDNEFGSDVAVVLNASEKNVHFLGTKEDIEGFKKWLEENRASKVVDENGEPLVVYHFTNKEFDTFKIGESGALYFTNDRTGQQVFSPNKLSDDFHGIPVFLSIKNPATTGPFGQNFILPNKLDRFNKIQERINELKAVKNKTSAIIEELENLDEELWDYDKIDIRKITESIKVELTGSGSDGIIATWSKDENFYVALNPNQIKSATDNVGSFSVYNDDIRYRRVSQPAIEQYYRDKLMYGNLSDSDRQFLQEKGITVEDYNNMSQKEKEVLFFCR